MTQIPSGTKFVGIASTVPTPENRSSQNNAFQEVYTMQDIADTVETALGGYTETIVTIPSSAAGTITYSDGRPNATGGILGMGSSAIELLPQPGANKYYDIEKIVLEYTHVTTAYVMAATDFISIGGGTGYQSSVAKDLIEGAYNQFAVVNKQDGVSALSEVSYNWSGQLNQSLNMQGWDGSNPTLGDGTLRVKIYHKTITFGA